MVLVAIHYIALMHWYPEAAVAMKPLSGSFVKLIRKMAIAPIICHRGHRHHRHAVISQSAKVAASALLVVSVALIIGRGGGQRWCFAPRRPEHPLCFHQ